MKSRGVPHGQFHGSVISANGDPYETFALSIDQLRRLRNSLCHSTSTELDQNMFDHYVNLAKDAFEALSVKTDSIDETLHAELHTLRARVLTCAFFFFAPFIEFCQPPTVRFFTATNPMMHLDRMCTITNKMADHQ